MKQYQVKTLVSAILIATFSSSYAAQMTAQQIQALVDQVVAQKTKGLQQEVGQLKAEVIALKQQVRTTKVRLVPIIQEKISPNSATAAQSSRIYADADENSGVSYASNRGRIKKYPPYLVANDVGLIRLYLGGTPVFTSPYIGKHSAFDGSDLIVNQSTVNLDARLLKQGQALDNEFLANGFPIPKHPVVELSGDVEGAATAVKIQSHSNNTNNSTLGDLNLSGAEADIYAKANQWVFGYLSFAWQDTFNTPDRVNNTNAIVDKAFVTIGNLNKCPFYTSIGQLYVPFGQYSSYMISDPLTEDLGRTKGRALVGGFYPKGDSGLFGAAYVFRSNTFESNNRGNGGANLGYNFAINKLTGTIAVGAIANIADSLGMQVNGAPRSIPFAGFSMNAEAENISHSVPAVDVHGVATYKHLNLVGEYISTTKSFAQDAMTFNNYGAHPRAGQVEAAYTFTACGRPGNVAIGYNWTKEALALLLPKERYIAAINYSIWRDTMLSFELRRDRNYSARDTASGAGSSTFTPLNKYVNMATMQFAVFF